MRHALVCAGPKGDEGEGVEEEGGMLVEERWGLLYAPFTMLTEFSPLLAIFMSSSSFILFHQF